MDRRSKLKKKENLKEDDEQEILDIEIKIAEKCQDGNRKKVIENFGLMAGNDGNLHHQGIWKNKSNLLSLRGKRI